jgi:hypothetical protein
VESITGVAGIDQGSHLIDQGRRGIDRGSRGIDRGSRGIDRGSRWNRSRQSLVSIMAVAGIDHGSRWNRSGRSVESIRRFPSSIQPQRKFHPTKATNRSGAASVRSSGQSFDTGAPGYSIGGQP